MRDGAVDARPFLRASANSLWAKAELAADDFVAAIREELSKQGVDAAVTRSPNGTHPIVVRLDAWIPPDIPSSLGRTVRRVALSITSRVLPFNRTKFVFDVAFSRDDRSKAFPGLLNFTRAEAQHWVRYALGIGDNPRAGEAVQVMLVSMIGLAMLSPRFNPFDRQFRNGFPPPIPVVLFWLGALVIGYGVVLIQSRPYEPYPVYDEPYPSPAATPEYAPEYPPAAEAPAAPYEAAPYADAPPAADAAAPYYPPTDEPAPYEPTPYEPPTDPSQ